MEIRPLSARSVVLSLLLGNHPPVLAGSALVEAGRYFGIAESTLRVALTRMVAAGELERTDGDYRLAGRLVERQQRQDDAIDPVTTAWDGTWTTVVITTTGRSAAERAELRVRLGDLRLAELREGVWMRPANLARALPDWPGSLITVLTATPGDPHVLTRSLWDLEGWTATGTALLTAMATIDPTRRLAAAAALVRHLRTDPALPEALLPRDWNAPELRSAYAAYQAEIAERAIRITPRL